ncbi:MAG: lipopolysaccharide biosynthesis protein [Pseudobdellovibrionaceae bacterium]|jgi:O-antigen/teichoic acid export membrane protein|nr:lipopolysaccharide biosynthesis protein [Pseudobdellovibrionaceae bacterium]
MSPSGHHVGRNALWSVLNQTAGQMMVLVVFLVTARFISQEDFGTMAIAMLIAEIMRQLTIESVGLSLMARPSPQDQDYNAGFLIILFSSIAGAVLVFLGASPLAQLMGNPSLEHAIHWICLIILTFGASKTHETWLAKTMQFKTLALRSIICIAIGGGVGITMAVHGFGLMSLIAQQIITTLLGAVFLWSVTKWRPSFDTTKDHIFSILKFSRYLSFNSTANLINAQSDVFLSAYFLGAAPAGIYNAAKRLILSANLVMTSAIGQVSMSALSNISQDKEKLRQSYLDFNLFTCLFTAPAFFGLAALSVPVVGILLGDKWSDVAPILSILCFPALIISFGQLSSQIFLIINKPYYSSVFAALNAITNILLLVVLASFGLTYVAVAFALKTILLFPIQLTLAHRILGLSNLLYFKKLLPSLMSSCIMGGALYFALPFLENFGHTLSILIATPCGAALYFFFLYLLDRSSVLMLVSFAKDHFRKGTA